MHKKSKRSGFKKKLALLMTFVMAMSLLGAVSIQGGYVDRPLTPPNTEHTIVPATTSPSAISFNLGTREVTVGHVGDPTAERFFDENGHYSIQLEDNAFFPYEVQFRVGETFSTVWFTTPECVITVEEYVFSVYSAATDPSVLTQIGLYVGSRRVAVYPVPKEFVNLSFVPFSLLPLETRDFVVNLASIGVSPPELTAVRISTIFSGQTFDPDANPYVVWARTNWQNTASTPHRIVDANGTIDLLHDWTYSWDTNNFLPIDGRLEIIVGDANQLNPNNIRYNIIIANPAIPNNWLDVELYVQDGDIRNNVSTYAVNATNTIIDGALTPAFNITVNSADLPIGADVYMGLNWGAPFTAHPAQVRVFRGRFSNASDAIASQNEVTDIIWNQQNMSFNGGLLGTFVHSDQYDFTIVLEEYGMVTGVLPVRIWISRFSNQVTLNNNIRHGTTGDWIPWSQPQTRIQDGVRIITVPLQADINIAHHVQMNFIYRGNSYSYLPEATNPIQRAVRGHFTNELDIIAEPCIAYMLFTSTRYTANFSGAGHDFTMLDIDGNVYRFTVNFTQGEIPQPPLPPTPGTPSTTPRPGSADTFFRVTGATYLSATNINNERFIMPFQHDTYYAMGFQTVFFIRNDVPLSAITPTFITGTPGVNVYSGHGGAAGIRQTSGVNTHDFSTEPVHYSVAATDGESLRNYWVTFVQQVEGAQLFVNGINDPARGAVREVFFNDVFGFHHDVFIANIGDEQITGLRAELINVSEVRPNYSGDDLLLCDYWTVGGINNDTLAAFTSVGNPNATELQNIAKIRILPSHYATLTGAPIHGTLRITYDQQQDGPVEIELTGVAGNPAMLTQDPLPDAVRFVPYAILLRHNNMHDWNQVSWQVSGNLPPGLELRPNGEIYGIPQATGIFTFTVTMVNSHYEFPNVSRELTIEVLPNTNENVYLETDSGYEIRPGGHVGIPLGGFDFIVTERRDHVFLSEGDFGEFIDFWFNGIRLSSDVDYTVEDGSTRIVIREQTFENHGNTDGSPNTIAAEFRTNDGCVDTGVLNRTAQNFRLEPVPQQPQPQPQPPADGGNGNVGGVTGGGADDHTPSTLLPIRPTHPVQPTTPGADPEQTEDDQPPVDIISQVEDDPALQEGITRPSPIVVPVIVEGQESDGTIRLYPTMDEINAALVNGQLQAMQIPGAPIILEFQPDYMPAHITEVVLVLCDEGLAAIANSPNASFALNAGRLGALTINKPEVHVLVGRNGEITEIVITRTNGEAQVSVYVDGVPLALDNIRVFLPNLGAGNVPQLTNLQGLVNIIRKSVVENGNVFAILSTPGTVKLIQADTFFTDVSPENWFSNAVDFVAGRELFIGVGEAEFAPGTTMSRGMMTTVLHRLNSTTVVGTESRFQDVAADRWYTNAIVWAHNAGIVSGYGNGNFGPVDSITREQMAVIMMNYAQYLGLATVERGNITKFADSQQISPWAEDAMRWAVGTGLIIGNGVGLSPRDYATRAEVAELFTRFIDMIVRYGV